MLELDFTGAANVADVGAVDGYVRKVILTIIESMAVLPNRFLVKLDANNDYFKTYLYPLGIVRVTIDRAWGFAEGKPRTTYNSSPDHKLTYLLRCAESKSATGKFFSKLTRASPDCYANVNVGAEETWKTSTKSNTTTPKWRETHDFVVTDFDQCIKVDVEDEDVGGDDEVGIAATTVKDILTAGGHEDLALIRKGQDTDGKVSVAAQFFKFEATAGSFSAPDHKGDGKLCGLVTILVASAFGIKGQREQLKPSVVVTWGEKHKFQTAIKEDAPGTDINNPAFDQNFRIPITADLVGSGAESFRIALMDGEKEVGGKDVPFAEVLKAPDMILRQHFDMGGEGSVRAAICLRGVTAATMEQTAGSAGMALPQRPKQ